MELDIEKVLESFQLYSGEQLNGENGDREALCRKLCGDSAAMIGGWLNPSLEGRDLSPAESLAAAEAFYQLVLLDRALQPETVSTPELRMEQGSREQYARQLREEKRRACQGLLQESDFYFGQM